MLNELIEKFINAYKLYLCTDCGKEYLTKDNLVECCGKFIELKCKIKK